MIDETNNEQAAATAEKTQDTTETTAAQALDALMPSASQAAGGDGRDARIAELERELQQERVEKGRLRQTNDELRKAHEEIARLKAENANLTRRGPADYLSDEDREKIDADQLEVIDKMVQGRVGDMSAAAKAENERLRAELARRDASAAEMRKAAFDAEVERLAPGLVQAVAEGHRDEWLKWSGERRRAASVADAFRAFDAGTVAEFLTEFAESKGIHAEGDGLAARTSTFSPRGGNRPAAGGRDQTVYTVEQVNAALRAAAADFEAGKISLDERRAIQKKYDAAYAEGRVAER